MKELIALPVVSIDEPGDALNDEVIDGVDVGAGPGKGMMGLKPREFMEENEMAMR